MAKFCPTCGVELQNPDAIACPSCGGAINVQQLTCHTPHKSPFLAAILSLLISGLGQIYNGQFGKGILYFLIAVLCRLTLDIGIGVILWPLWWIVGMVDAYVSAGKINRGEYSDKIINFR